MAVSQSKADLPQRLRDTVEALQNLCPLRLWSKGILGVRYLNRPLQSVQYLESKPEAFKFGCEAINRLM